MNDLNKIEKYLSKPMPTEFIENTHIPIFAPRKPEEDKYDKNFEAVDTYTGIYAYGYKLLNTGGTESLYRTIDSVILSNFSRDQNHLFLDVGCGIGRTLYDLADLFPASLFIGMDYSYKMLTRASQILFEEKELAVDLSAKGLGTPRLSSRKPVENVILSQGNALDIPFEPGIFDCVTNTFLVDRVSDPKKAIEESVRMLKKGGLFIFSNPLNFNTAKGWETFGKTSLLIEFIQQTGIDIQEWFDGLVFREIKDLRGNYSEWEALFVFGKKR